MSERYLRRKLTFSAHGRTLVLVKRPQEKIEHRVMMALLWALYLPHYPDLRIDVPIGARYRPDLVQLDGESRPIFWGEAGEVGAEKLRALCTRYRETHLVFAKWNSNLDPFATMIDVAINNARRTAPVELIGFDAQADRFVGDTGEIQISFADVTRRQWMRAGGR
jgi:hypothetical protein